METSRRHQSKKDRIKRKVLKKINFFNAGIIIFSIFVGYAVASFFPLKQGYQADAKPVGQMSKSALHIADSLWGSFWWYLEIPLNTPLKSSKLNIYK